MRVLVAYSSKYGSTRGIADRIGERLRIAGHEVDVEECDNIEYPEGFDAFIVGSAAYMGNWRKEARKFVQHNRELLASRPTWLFSSGPLGTARVDKEGKDVLIGAAPKQFEEYEEEVHPRGTMVFFGALEKDKLRGTDRLVSWMPENDALPEGDFRDWDAIDAWADKVAAELETTNA
ncbi:MAG TPA: flavodoxin domain-containing protein [Agromyces sp.]|nr:flavodoxin domain-containing protein [Agromyces sp.]